MKRSKARTLCVLALLSALCVGGRWAFSALPNIQPMSAVTLLIVEGMGLQYGIVVALLSLLLSNIFLGFGPWTLAQMAAYVCVCAFHYAMVRLFAHRRFSMGWLTCGAGASGFLYGLVVSFNALAFLPITALPAYYIAGLAFDAAHAASNAIFYFTLKKPLLRVIERFWRVTPE